MQLYNSSAAAVTTQQHNNSNNNSDNKTTGVAIVVDSDLQQYPGRVFTLQMLIIDCRRTCYQYSEQVLLSNEAQLCTRRECKTF